MFEQLNSFFSKIGKKAGIGIGIVFILLLMIPFPEVIAQVMMGLSLVFSVVYMVLCIKIKKFEKKRLLPEANLLLSLFIFVSDIQVTRIILSKPELTGFFSIGARLIANPLMAVILDGIYAVFVAVILFIVVKKMRMVTEISARFCLDSMNYKLFDIENQFCNQKITKQESDFYKEQVRTEVEFYSAMDGNLKFIKGTIEALAFISVVQLFGGCLISTSKKILDIESAVIMYSRVTCLTSFFFLFCMIIIIIGFECCIKGPKILKSFDDIVLTDYSFANYNYNFVISLGPGLNRLTEGEENTLVTLLQELRKEIDIPKVFIRKDKDIGETEYIVSWKGKIIRGALDLREGESLCATEIIETVRKMWEG